MPKITNDSKARAMMSSNNNNSVFGKKQKTKQD